MSDPTWICTNNPWHDWDGLTCRWCDATRTPAEAIVSGLASRRGGTEDAAKALLDAHRSEVLAEADLLPKANVVAWLVKKAREDTPVWQLASKVDRGAVRPDNLRMLPPDFFEPGHSYTHRDGTDFHCVAVTAHPQTGERLAMGWHVDSWGLHYPATVGINQWRHEYDGVQPPTSTEAAE
jgi:hypothetical protein